MAVQVKGVLSLIGGFLIHLTLGTIYTFGNMNPYLTSYIRERSSPSNLRYTELVWLFTGSLIGQGGVMFLGGVILKKLGTRITTLIGGWFMSLAVILSYFAVKSSFYPLIVTYGLMFGVGIGTAYAIPLATAMKWFPEHKGLVNGIVVAGFGGGAFIFDQIQTAYINPTNLKPELPNPDPAVDEKYFDEPSLLDKVPSVFLILGGVYAVMQLIGTLLLFEPEGSSAEINTDKREEEQPLFSESEEISEISRDLDHWSPRTESEHVDSWHPKQMLKSKHFYMLWFMFLFNGQSVVFTSTLYKAYGQTFISNDRFFALVGAFASIFNACGRIFWGFIADRFSFRIAMMILCASMMALMMTFIGTSRGGEAMYFIWVCLLFGVFSGNFALFPTAIAKSFGHQYVAINFGLVFTSQVITAPIGAILTSQLLSLIDWFGMFSLIAAFSLIGLVLAYFYDKKTITGRHI